LARGKKIHTFWVVRRVNGSVRGGRLAGLGVEVWKWGGVASISWGLGVVAPTGRAELLVLK